MGRRGKKGTNLIFQGGILAVTVLLAQLCALLRHIPLTRRWGDVGNGIYGMALGLCGTGWLLAAYGLPLALSGLIQVRMGRGQHKSANNVMRIGFLYAAAVGGGLAAALFFGSAPLAGTVLRQSMAAPVLKLFSLALFFGALGSALRGFYLGNGAVLPVAASMVLEQVVAIGAGFPLSRIAGDYGAKVGALLQNENFELSFGAAGFAGGITAGAAASFLLLLVLYPISCSYFRKKDKRMARRGRETVAEAAGAFFVALAPLCLYGILMEGYVVMQQLFFTFLMEDRLSGDVILAHWGMYVGKYKLVTAIPPAIGAAMCIRVRSRIGFLSRKGDLSRLQGYVRCSVKAILLLAIPLSVSLGVLGEPLFDAFFPGQDGEAAGALLLVGFVTGIFFTAAHAMSRVLWAIGRVGGVLFGAAVAFVLQAGALYVLLELLELDIFGVVCADIIYSFTLVAVTGIFLQRACHFRYGLLRINLPPVVAAAVMGGVQFLGSRALGTILTPFILLPVCFLVGLLVYGAMLLLLRGATQRELALVPGGKWLSAAGRSVHLL